MQFLTLPPGDERGRLVPVLQKILTLTNDETQKIHAIAKGKKYLGTIRYIMVIVKRGETSIIILLFL